MRVERFVGQPWPHITLMEGMRGRTPPLLVEWMGLINRWGEQGRGPRAALWLLERGLQSQHERKERKT